MKKIVIFLIILILLVAGLFIWKTKIATQSPHTLTEANRSKQLPKEATITLTKDGFSPREVTIQTGGAVRWHNASGDKQTVNSDDYPSNQKHKELNFGVFTNGSSVTYTFTKTGTYGYHNQFKPEQKGKVIVK